MYRVPVRQTGSDRRDCTEGRGNDWDSHTKHMMVGRPFAFFYSIAGLHAKQLLQLVACARYVYSRSTLRVSYEYLGMTMAFMRNKIRIRAFY